MTASQQQSSPLVRSGPESRALVVIPESEASESFGRPLAGFLTQLIASSRRMRAYRRAGRTEPREAVQLYRQPAERPATGLDFSV